MKLENLSNQFPSPLFLLGHSMGGTIALDYLLHHQDKFKGMVISAPVIKVGDSISQVTITMSKLLSKIAPKMGVLALEATAISRDTEVVDAYVNDPLVFHGKTPARLGVELLSAMMRITVEIGKITLPMIIVQGSKDVLVDPSGAQMLFEKASSQDKTLKIYDGFYHEVFNEPERELVLKDVEEWLETKLKE